MSRYIRTVFRHAKRTVTFLKSLRTYGFTEHKYKLNIHIVQARIHNNKWGDYMKENENSQVESLFKNNNLEDRKTLFNQLYLNIITKTECSKGRIYKLSKK